MCFPHLNFSKKDSFGFPGISDLKGSDLRGLAVSKRSKNKRKNSLQAQKGYCNCINMKRKIIAPFKRLELNTIETKVIEVIRSFSANMTNRQEQKMCCQGHSL